MRNAMPLFTRLLSLLCLAAIAAPTDAAEIQLRQRAAPRSGLVLLSDLADVYAVEQDEADELAATELFPAPPQGAKRFVRLSEIQEALTARGVRLAAHTFSGASQVEVQAAAPLAAAPAPKRRRELTTSQQGRANRAARDAIQRHLREAANATADWSVEVELTAEQARAVVECGSKLTASGGAAPWTGEQPFELLLGDGAQPAALQITAAVSLPPSIVVLKLALGRGTVLQEDDLELLPLPSGGREGEFFTTLEEAIGLETTQAVAAGQALSAAMVRPPLLVRRGEAVTVYVRARGVRVRTVARARGDGAEGETITVESMTDRKTYLVRVTGVQEVEVQSQTPGSRPERTAGRAARRGAESR